jgi:hypothetical protein
MYLTVTVELVSLQLSIFWNPALNLKTMDISDLHKTGKHTTTFSAL